MATSRSLQCFTLIFAFFQSHSKDSAPPSPVLVSWADKSFTLKWPASESNEWTERTPEGRPEIQCKEESEDQWHSVHRLVNFHHKSYVVEKVKTGMFYLCRVKLFRYGEKIYSNSVTVKTHMAMIAPPPGSIRVASRDREGNPVVAVSWATPEAFEGDVERYVVEVKEHRAAKAFRVVVPGNRHYVDIKTVKPNRLYGIRIRADVNGTSGFYSKWYRVVAHVTPQSAPDRLTVTNIEDHTAFLRWYPSTKTANDFYRIMCTGDSNFNDAYGKLRHVHTSFNISAKLYQVANLSRGKEDDDDLYVDDVARGPLSYELMGLNANMNYTCSVQGHSMAGLSRQSKPTVFITATMAAPPPLQPVYLPTHTNTITTNPPDQTLHSFKLHPASSQNGPISHYQVVIIPRGNLNPLPIKEPPEVFFTKSPPQEKDIASLLPHPRPYVAAHFTADRFSDIVTLVSPYRNVSRHAKPTERFIEMFWVGLYVSVSLRAFVESSDKRKSSEFVSSSQFSDPVFISQVMSHSHSGKVKSGTRKESSTSPPTVAIVFGVLIGIVVLLVALKQSRVCYLKYKRAKDRRDNRWNDGPWLANIPSMSSMVYGHTTSILTSRRTEPNDEHKDQTRSTAYSPSSDEDDGHTTILNKIFNGLYHLVGYRGDNKAGKLYTRVPSEDEDESLEGSEMSDVMFEREALTGSEGQLTAHELYSVSLTGGVDQERTDKETQTLEWTNMQTYDQHTSNSEGNATKETDTQLLQITSMENDNEDDQDSDYSDNIPMPGALSFMLKKAGLRRRDYEGSTPDLSNTPSWDTFGIQLGDRPPSDTLTTKSEEQVATSLCVHPDEVCSDHWLTPHKCDHIPSNQSVPVAQSDQSVDRKLYSIVADQSDGELSYCSDFHSVSSELKSKHMSNSITNESGSVHTYCSDFHSESSQLKSKRSSASTNESDGVMQRDEQDERMVNDDQHSEQTEGNYASVSEYESSIISEDVSSVSTTIVNKTFSYGEVYNLADAREEMECDVDSVSGDSDYQDISPSLSRSM